MKCPKCGCANSPYIETEVLCGWPRVGLTCSNNEPNNTCEHKIVLDTFLIGDITLDDLVEEFIKPSISRPKKSEDEWSRCSNCGRQEFRVTCNSKETEFILRCVYCSKVTKISDLGEPIKPAEKSS